MERIAIAEREDWKALAAEMGFDFHTIDGAPYWVESACYRFTLAQIENDIEDPSSEIEGMCFEVVEAVHRDEEVLRRLAIPEDFWDYISSSWRNRERNLYGRLDFAYDGNGPAKLLEYNADTPTSLYESAAFQWVWLEQAIEAGIIPADCDQFNSLQEKLISALANFGLSGTLHLAASAGSPEDEGTVRYLQDCAVQAGLTTKYLHLQDIGVDPAGCFTDLDDERITSLFKLYPWEWLMRDEFGEHVPASDVTFIEPAWKALVSNKGMMALLWERFEGHPNLLPTYFADDPRAADMPGGYVRKPLYSREGANIELVRPGEPAELVDGPYGAEGSVVQALQPLPQFDGNYTVLGSWLVASQACGIGIREDDTPITRDTSRFLPHVIRD